MDPFDPNALGFQKDEKLIRIYHPTSKELFIKIQDQVLKPQKKNSHFYELSWDKGHHEYSLLLDGKQVLDPYSFKSCISDIDEQLFMSGNHPRLWKVLGGRLCTLQKIKGAKFCCFAPHAKAVSIVGDFNEWDDGRHFLKKRKSGIFELFIPWAKAGQRYHFCIFTPEGEMLKKADPFGLEFEQKNSKNALLKKVHFKFDPYIFESDWKNKPINIYEMHLGSWKHKPDGSYYSYREIAPILASYLKQMHYTHVEFLPLNEHPFDDSWGYQVSGYFAPTKRFGRVKDLQFLINYLHQHGIGVIIDWVPGHFPKDQWALKYFDGTHLFEPAHTYLEQIPKWSTQAFDFGSPRIANFLICSCLYWFETFQVDAIRVDAVDSMLFQVFGKEKVELNILGTTEHIEGRLFLNKLTNVCKKYAKGRILIAEDSSMESHLTNRSSQVSFGFDFKWNVGFYYDVFKFFEKNDFSWLKKPFAYHHLEHFILPLSHDEVFHRGRLLLKESDFDFAVTFLTFKMCFPGKKLTFMGTELKRTSAWNCQKPLDWENKDMKMQQFVQKLNAFYLQTQDLYLDDSLELIFEDPVGHIIFQRGHLFCAFNFSKILFVLPFEKKALFFTKEIEKNTLLSQSAAIFY
jgi:1,4-alpha-glucan branching enzyme